MLVSVVIPVYNRESSIGRALNSVLKQSYQHFEVIVVDDASEDATLNRVKSFNDTRIRCVEHTINRGAGAARNTGILEAQGKYIAFLDSDDEWAEDKLAIQLTQMLEESDLVIEVTCTGFILNLLDDNKKIINDLSHHKGISDFIVSGCDVSPGSTLVAKKSVFDEIGPFDERMARLEDWDWLLRFYRHKGNIGLIHQPLAVIHNKRGGNGKALEESVPFFMENHELFFNELGFFRKRKILSDVWLQVAGTYRREKELLKTIKSLLLAHVWDPLVLLRYWVNKSYAT